MTFLAVFLVLMAIQYWSVERYLQNDGWYLEWRDRVAARFGDAPLTPALQLLVPLLGVWLLLDLCEKAAPLLMFVASLPVLVYSLGRNSVGEQVSHYVDAARRGDNAAALEVARQLGANLSDSDDWPHLHRAVLRRISYTVLEGRFTPIFWFILLGPLGALFYRLAQLSAQSGGDDNAAMSRLVAWLEWPAVRVLGASLALTGNFSSCVNQCLDTLLDVGRSSTAVLEHFVHGALNINQRGVMAESVSEHEVEALQPLFSRTLILWVCVLALFSLL